MIRVGVILAFGVLALLTTHLRLGWVRVCALVILCAAAMIGRGGAIPWTSDKVRATWAWVPFGVVFVLAFLTLIPTRRRLGALGFVFWFGVWFLVADTCAGILLTPVYPEMFPNVVAALFGYRIAPFWLAAAPFWLAGLATMMMLLQAVRDERALKFAPPHCSKCGYDLTGNLSGTCPECGYRLPTSPQRPKCNG